jgi:hypothetical protein
MTILHCCKVFINAGDTSDKSLVWNNRESTLANKVTLLSYFWNFFVPANEQHSLLRKGYQADSGYPPGTQCETQAPSQLTCPGKSTSHIILSHERIFSNPSMPEQWPWNPALHWHSIFPPYITLRYKLTGSSQWQSIHPETPRFERTPPTLIPSRGM